MPDPQARPRQVTMAGWVTIVGSVLVIASVFAQIGSLDSLDTRRGVEDLLADPPADGLGLEVSTVLSAIRVLAMITGACAAATAILGWLVMQRSRPARLALSILAVPMFLAGFVTGGFTTSLVAAAAVVLWLQPARAWVNGDPVPERYLRPTEQQRRPERSGPQGSDSQSSGSQGSGSQGSDSQGSGSQGSGPQGSGPQGSGTQGSGTQGSGPQHSGSQHSTGPGTRPQDAPAEPGPGATGPAAYPGFGSAPAATQVAPGPAPHPAPAWPTATPRPARGEMPNPLRAGLILTWVTCALVVLGLGLSVVAMALDPALVDREIERAIAENPAMAGEVTPAQVRIAIFVVLAGFATWALGAVVLAAVAWVGRSWAWVLLCVSAGLSAGLFLAVTVLGGLVAAVPLALAAGSLALMLRPEVREWYRAR